MPGFKPKANKKIALSQKSVVTLDGKHNEKMHEFAELEDKVIPALRKQRRELRQQLEEATTVDAQLELRDRYRLLGKRIRALAAKKKKYLLDNSQFLLAEPRRRVSRRRMSTLHSVI